MTRVTPAMKRALRQIHEGKEAALPSTRRLAAMGLLVADPTLPTDAAQRTVEVIARRLKHESPFVLTPEALGIIGVSK